MVGQRRQWKQAVEKESESGADVNGGGSKQLGGGSPGGHGGCVTGSHTAWRVFVCDYCTYYSDFDIICVFYCHLCLMCAVNSFALLFHYFVFCAYDYTCNY